MTVPLGPTVFVVDDEAPVRRALSRMLRANRFAVATFASSKEFLGQYDPDASGCLVLDIMMPGNGLELQRILQKKGCTLPIIFLTGYGDVSKSVQALKGGAIDFLTKPVNDQSLLRARWQSSFGFADIILKSRSLRRRLLAPSFNIEQGDCSIHLFSALNHPRPITSLRAQAGHDRVLANVIHLPRRVVRGVHPCVS